MADTSSCAMHSGSIAPEESFLSFLPLLYPYRCIFNAKKPLFTEFITPEGLKSVQTESIKAALH